MARQRERAAAGALRGVPSARHSRGRPRVAAPAGSPSTRATFASGAPSPASSAARFAPAVSSPSSMLRPQARAAGGLGQLTRRQSREHLMARASAVNRSARARRLTGGGVACTRLPRAASRPGGGRGHGHASGHMPRPHTRGESGRGCIGRADPLPRLSAALRGGFARQNLRARESTRQSAPAAHRPGTFPAALPAHHPGAMPRPSDPRIPAASAAASIPCAVRARLWAAVAMVECFRLEN